MNKKFLTSIMGVCLVAAVALPCLAVVKAPQNSLTTPAVGVQAVNTSLNAKKEPCKTYRQHCVPLAGQCCKGLSCRLVTESLPAKFAACE